MLVSNKDSFQVIKMELTQNLKLAAEKILRFEGVIDSAVQIEGTAFFVAKENDQSILAHGVIVFNGKEYKIGTKKKKTV